MTLQQCRYIMEIERCRSLTEAAKRLFVTQPSITKAVRELEKELGITILKRTNRGVDFTPEGKELASYARLLVEQADAAEIDHRLAALPLRHAGPDRFDRRNGRSLL